MNRLAAGWHDRESVDSDLMAQEEFDGLDERFGGVGAG